MHTQLHVPSGAEALVFGIMLKMYEQEKLCMTAHMNMLVCSFTAGMCNEYQNFMT